MPSADRTEDRSGAVTLRTTLGALRDDADADAALFLRFGQHLADPVITEVAIDGTAAHWPLMRDGVGPDGFDHDCSDDALSPRRGQWCLQAPAERHFNEFCWLDEDIAQVTPWEQSDAFRTLYEPNGFSDQYRAILADHGEVTGWVALLWKRPPRQRELVESRVRDRLEQLGDIAGQRHQQPRDSHRLLLDSRGDRIARDSGMQSVFDETALRQIRLLFRPTFGQTEETARIFRGYQLSAVPMSGEGARAMLVLVEPLEPVRIDMRRALTSLQRKVAELVADGHSNREAADVLDVSVNTVKYHLKNIYPILGVSNRVELASLLSRSR